MAHDGIDLPLIKAGLALAHKVLRYFVVHSVGASMLDRHATHFKNEISSCLLALPHTSGDLLNASELLVGDGAIILSARVLVRVLGWRLVGHHLCQSVLFACLGPPAVHIGMILQIKIYF